MLWNRIAYDWGIPLHVFLEQHTSSQLTELLAYLRKEPHGYEIENYRSGVIAATVANVGPRRRGTKPLTPKDFYPVVGKQGIQLSPRQMKQLEEKRKREKAKK